MNARLAIPSLTLRLEGGALTWLDNQTGRRLIRVPGADLFAPVIDGRRAALAFSHVEESDANRLDLHFTADGLDYFRLHVEARTGEDAFDLSCSFRVARAGQLNALEFFPAETALDFYELVNFRNRHFYTDASPQFLLEPEAGFKTDTYSTDWQFAPHPTLFILRKHDLQLFFGAFDLPRAFGMYIDVADKKVRDWHLDYGAAPHGQPLAAGEEFVSPRFRLFTRREPAVEGMLDIYARMLIDAGQIPNPADKVREPWHREPLYCTWIDQCLLANYKPPVELKDQAAGVGTTAGTSAPEIVSDKMVRQAVEVIERERLPFRAILLDGGWANTGQWNPSPRQFPDLRQLVDFLHGKGFKVVVWWNWAEIHEGAEADPAHLIGGGTRNRHGARVRDYSRPATQDYLRKLFRQLFSSDPGCYDLDGVKTDFLADKVHADAPVSDPAWRGEENYFLHVTRLFYAEMKKHKPDAMHMGCAGNFWLAPYIDINRTYDVPGTNYLQHETRGRMLAHTTPGCPVSYDFHNWIENLDKYLALAHAHAASVQIGNILLVQEDPATPPGPPSPDYFALLRRALPFQRLT
jgi:hypothetical protein